MVPSIPPDSGFSVTASTPTVRGTSRYSHTKIPAQMNFVPVHRAQHFHIKGPPQSNIFDGRITNENKTNKQTKQQRKKIIKDVGKKLVSQKPNERGDKTTNEAEPALKSGRTGVLGIKYRVCRARARSEVLFDGSGEGASRWYRRREEDRRTG